MNHKHIDFHLVFFVVKLDVFEKSNVLIQIGDCLPDYVPIYLDKWQKTNFVNTLKIFEFAICQQILATHQKR